jgi:hypothetical protein
VGWKKSLIALVVLLLFTTVGVLWATNILGWRAWRLQEVEDFIGASLPQGTAGIHFATENQKTRIVWLRFDLPPDVELSALLPQAAALRPDFTPFPNVNPQEAGLTWWNPQNAVHYAGLYDNTGQKIIEVLLDNDHRIIYIRAYSIAAQG